MPSRELNIPFPTSGVVAETSYSETDPKTTRTAKNVTPDDSSESRTRGGSRPGLIKRYSSALDGFPLYLVRVSVGQDTRVYEYLVAGTNQNVFVGRSVASGTIPPITYTETLNPLTGDLFTEAGVALTTENDVDLVIDEFNLDSVDRNNVVAYRGNVVIGAANTVVASGTGTVSNTSLDSVSVPNWTTLGINNAIHVVDITSTNSNVIQGTYTIASVSSGEVTLGRNPLVSGVGPVTCTYTIRVGVRLLDTETPTLSLLTPTGGFIPVGTDAVAVYRDRLVWAIGRTWYMSRQGDPGDYDYGADPEDPARAIAGNASDAGQPADPIIAMVSVGFDYLAIFAENSIWIMRGDPGYGGQLYNLSRTAGCVSNKAWCYGESTDIFFLAKDGLYYMPEGGGAPEPLSSLKIPRELRGIDRDNFYVTLAYEPNDDGVLIFITPRTGERGSHWWFDIDTKSFWPIEFANNSHQPIDALTFGGAPTRIRRAVLASFDGFIREWNGTDDDGVAIVSHIVLGPFGIATQGDFDAILTELVGVLSVSSGNVTIKVYAGNDAESVSDDAHTDTGSLFSATVSNRRSFTIRPRVRGLYVCFRLESSSQWSFEGLLAKVADAGKRRFE